jgi:hypothetical protein
MRKRRLLLLVSLITIAGVAGAVTHTAYNRTAQKKQLPYTVVWEETAHDTETGKATLRHTETRYVASNGNWRSIKRYADGKTEDMFAEVGRGVYVQRKDKMIFLSNHSLPGMVVTAEGFRNSPDYLRTETILGLEAMVMKPMNEPPGRNEAYRVPALGGDFIKTISYGKITLVKEPVSITFGEPDAALVKMPDGLPVDRSHFEKLHGTPANNN